MLPSVDASLKIDIGGTDMSVFVLGALSAAILQCEPHNTKLRTKYALYNIDKRCDFAAQRC